jgi:hypothetical protein
MSPTLLNFSPVQLNPAGGAVSVVLNGNVDTTMNGRFAWFPDDPNRSTVDRVVNAGESFVVEMTRVQAGGLRRLAWSFAAAPVSTQVRHLFVRVTLAQAAVGALLAFDYEIDLPQGHNRWELIDGITLQL